MTNYLDGILHILLAFSGEINEGERLKNYPSIRATQIYIYIYIYNYNKLL